MSLAGVDLNLLLALDALLSECNVTRAAERLSVGQPAMSASLARLRRHFNDPLLVKVGRRMVPTPLAESLVRPVHDAISATEAVMGTAETFDPATGRRTFRIIASDYVLYMLLQPLFTCLATEAPHVQVTVLPLQPDFADQLRRGHADLLVAPAAIVGQPVFPHRPLFTDRFVLACDRANPDVGDEVSPAEFSRLRYLSYGVAPWQTLAERELDELGIPRRVEVRAQCIVLVPFLLTGTRLVSLVPERVARSVGDPTRLRVLEPPAPLHPIVQAMYWTPRHTEDPAHRWLRGRLAGLAAELQEPPRARRTRRSPR
ncbi:LysR family transcriptional regulator [Streptomyces sp. MAR4 CNX-425]|uniref:LysR family transcriptional regulator n=1 Tax=Streptomyces sp. MAR4 CNX-425 TaxID=3406343 RepID=UPI003B502F41